MFPAEPLPDMIGTYRVLRRLPGQGSVETYLGRTEGPMGFHRDCVLKVMPSNADGDTQFAEDLAREAAICSQMNHPAIVRMFDFFEHEGKVVLVLEHIEGVSLSVLLEHLAEKRKRIGDTAVFYIGHQIADAVAHAHAATDERGRPTPIIHRNLHPENILVALDGRVRLTGFGVGKILGRTPDTAIGTIKGRPGYMAPEQARGEPVTPKADVYGLGLLLWSLFSGRRPPTDGSWPAKLSSIRGDLPREILAMIDAALDRFPGTRKISAREIERWLHKVVPPEKGKSELREEALRYREEHPPDSSEVIVPLQPPPVVAVPPSVSSSASSVRFGAPPPGMPPPPPVSTGMRKKEDWRQSLPDVDNIDELFEAAKQPREDGSRNSGLPPVAKAAVAPPAPIAIIGAPPAKIAISPAALSPPPPPAAAPATKAPDPDRTAIPPAPPPARTGSTPTAPGVAPAPTRPESSPGTTTAVSPAMRLGSTPGAPAVATPPARPGSAPGTATPAPAVATPAPPLATPAAPPVATFGAPPVATPAAPPVVSTPGAPPVSTPAASTAAARPAPTFTALETLPPPPDDPVAPNRSTLPWKDAALTGRPSTTMLRVAPRRILGMTIIVSAITATVVVSVVLYFALRHGPSPRGDGVEATATSASAGVSARASAGAKVPAASAAPTAPTAPTAPRPTVPPATAPPPASTPAGPPSLEPSVRPEDLPYGYGFLAVTSSATAEVYLSGKLLGPANQALKVSCGRYFVRIAQPGGGRYPEWIGPGQTVNVRCQGMTKVDIQPGKR